MRFSASFSLQFIFFQSGDEDPTHGLNPESSELEKLRREKIAHIYEIERYKKRISSAIVLAIFGFAAAIAMVIWHFSPVEPSWEELRKNLLATPEEEMRLCVTMYPNSISRKFDPSEVGQPLMLSPLIKEGKYSEAAKASKVKNIFQHEVSKSYNGLFTSVKLGGYLCFHRVLCKQTADFLKQFYFEFTNWKAISFLGLKFLCNC